MTKLKQAQIKIIVASLLFISLIVFIIFYLGRSSDKDDLSRIKKGESIYNKNCAGCHYRISPSLYSPSLNEMAPLFTKIKGLKKDSTHKPYMGIISTDDEKNLEDFIKSYNNTQY